MGAPRLLAFLCIAVATSAQASQSPKTDLIPTFGMISPVARAANLPDRRLQYRVIFSVTKAADAPANLNPSLDKVARFVNLLAGQGIAPGQKDIVVILHGPATAIVLTDESYRARYGVPNPNLPLVRALRSAECLFMSAARRWSLRRSINRPSLLT